MLSKFIFHHIGYAVKNINITSKFYIESGFELSEIFIDTIQNVRVAFLTKKEFPIIELVEPINTESPVVKILEKNGVSTYHICYEVENIETEIVNMKKNKFISLFKPVSAVAFNHRKICYLYHNDFGLIELLNKN